MNASKPLLLAAVIAAPLALLGSAFAQDWTQTPAPHCFWQGVASSADGTKLIAAAYMTDTNYNPGWLFVSTNSGLTWRQTTAPNQFWERVASSSDGTKLVAIALADPGWNPG